MARIRIHTDAIRDWESFHAEFKQVLGFPEFYGANMDAWIDCMSSLREPEASGLAGIMIEKDELLLIEVPDAESFRTRLPDIVESLWDCTSFVNSRYVGWGESAAIVIVPANGPMELPGDQ